METFLQQFGSKIKGVLTGFDRIVFKGCLRHLAYAEGAARFLAGRGVLKKTALRRNAENSYGLPDVG